MEKELGQPRDNPEEAEEEEEAGRSGDSDLEEDEDSSSSSSDDDQTWTKEVKKEHKNIQVRLWNWINKSNDRDIL